ncbi:hypothetical protein Tco_1303143 [Tanacetum coccineum]
MIEDIEDDIMDPVLQMHNSFLATQILQKILCFISQVRINTFLSVSHSTMLILKSGLQTQVADPEMWDILKNKFEKSSTSASSCRVHDAYQGDDGPPEGEKRAKRQKTSRNNMGAIDINTLAIEQYYPLTRRDRPSVVIPILGNDVDFEIKSQFMSELRCNLFAGTDDENAHEHVRRVLEITDVFHIPGVTRDAVMFRVFPITLIGTARRCKNLLPTGSISTWDLLEKAFIRKYCPS